MSVHGEVVLGLKPGRVNSMVLWLVDNLERIEVDENISVTFNCAGMRVKPSLNLTFDPVRVNGEVEEYDTLS